jgi:hypothetical protein
MFMPDKESIIKAYIEMRNTAIREEDYDLLKKINKNIKDLTTETHAEPNYFQQQWLYNRFHGK